MKLGVERPCAPVHTGSRRLLPAACTVRVFQVRTFPHVTSMRRGKTRCEIQAAQNGIFLRPLDQHIPRVLLPGMLSKTQAEPGRCRGTLCHITLLFRGRCYSTAPDLHSPPYLLSPAALDQLLHIDLTPSQHFPPHLSPCKTSAGTLSLGSTW